MKATGLMVVSSGLMPNANGDIMQYDVGSPGGAVSYYQHIEPVTATQVHVSLSDSWHGQRVLFFKDQEERRGTLQDVVSRERSIGSSVLMVVRDTLTGEEFEIPADMIIMDCTWCQGKGSIEKKDVRAGITMNGEVIRDGNMWHSVDGITEEALDKITSQECEVCEGAAKLSVELAMMMNPSNGNREHDMWPPNFIVNGGS